MPEFEALATCFVDGALVQLFFDLGDGFQRIWTIDATGIRYIPARSQLAACCYRDIVGVFELTEIDGILWARRWPSFGMMLSSYQPADKLHPAHPTTPPPPEPIGTVYKLVPAALKLSDDARGEEANGMVHDQVQVAREWGEGWQALRIDAGGGCFDEPVYSSGFVGLCCTGGALGQSWQVGEYEGVLYAARRSM